MPSPTRGPDHGAGKRVGLPGVHLRHRGLEARRQRLAVYRTAGGLAEKRIGQLQAHPQGQDRCRRIDVAEKNPALPVAAAIHGNVETVGPMAVLNGDGQGGRHRLESAILKREPHLFHQCRWDELRNSSPTISVRRARSNGVRNSTEAAANGASRLGPSKT